MARAVRGSDEDWMQAGAATKKKPGAPAVKSSASERETDLGRPFSTKVPLDVQEELREIALEAQRLFRRDVLPPNMPHEIASITAEALRAYLPAMKKKLAGIR